MARIAGVTELIKPFGVRLRERPSPKLVRTSCAPDLREDRRREGEALALFAQRLGTNPSMQVVVVSGDETLAERSALTGSMEYRTSDWAKWVERAEKVEQAPFHPLHHFVKQLHQRGQLGAWIDLSVSGQGLDVLADHADHACYVAPYGSLVEWHNPATWEKQWFRLVDPADHRFQPSNATGGDARRLLAHREEVFGAWLQTSELASLFRTAQVLVVVTARDAANDPYVARFLEACRDACKENVCVVGVHRTSIRDTYGLPRITEYRFSCHSAWDVANRFLYPYSALLTPQELAALNRRENIRYNAGVVHRMVAYGDNQVYLVRGLRVPAGPGSEPGTFEVVVTHCAPFWEDAPDATYTAELLAHRFAYAVGTVHPDNRAVWFRDDTFHLMPAARQPTTSNPLYELVSRPSDPALYKLYTPPPVDDLTLP